MRPYRAPRVGLAAALLGGLGAVAGAAAAPPPDPDPSPSQVERHYQLGLLYRQREDAAAARRAVEEFQAVLALDSTHLNARFQLALCYYDAIRVREAVAELKRALHYWEARPRKPEDFNLAELYYALGYIQKSQYVFAEAARFLQQARSAGKRDGYPAFELGHLYYKQGEWARAAAALRQALEENPEIARAHYYLGLVLLDQERYPAAEEALLAYTRLRPDDPTAYAKLALLYEAMGNGPRARLMEAKSHAAFDREAAAARQATAAGWSLQEIQVRIDRGQYAAAAGEIAARLKTDPENALLWHLSGICDLRRERYRPAVEAFRAALRADPMMLATYPALGQCYERLGELERALALYRQAIQRDPAHPVHFGNYGRVAMQLGRWEEARRAYRQVLRLQPANAEAQVALDRIARRRPR